MIRYCQAHTGKVDAILVWKMDRFVRNTDDYVITRILLNKLNIRILSAIESNDETPNGRAMRTIITAIDQLDNEHRAVRTKDAMKLLSNYGYWVHAAPIGYALSRDGSGRPVLQPDPAKAALVTHVFQRAASGDSITSMTAESNAMGLRTRAGCKMTTRAMHEMLRKKIYAGIICTSLTDGREVRAKFEPLIDPHVWERVQLVLSGRGVVQKIHERTREEFPLRGTICCGSCGHKLTASTSRGRSNRYAYYHCVACGAVRGRSDKIHGEYAALLRTFTSSTSGRMKLIRHHIMAQWNNHKTAAQVERQMTLNAITALEAKRATLLDKLLSGTITDSVYREKDADLAIDIAAARSKTHSNPIEDTDVETAMDFAERIASSADQIWSRLSGQKRQRFQRALFPAGIVYDPKKGFGTAQSTGIMGILHAFGTQKTVWHPNRMSVGTEFIQFIRDLNELRLEVAA